MRPDTATPARFVAASLVGNALEWYDFFLFSAASALVFDKIFFSAGAGIFGAFATYAVGFAARPLGGIVFGLIGDRAGRNVALVWTLAIMGTATFLIGTLPTYSQLGWTSVVCLVLLRIVQGVAAGGEWGGGVLLISENTASVRRGKLTALSQSGVGLGFVMATGSLALAQWLSGEAFLEWGWRVPFLLSALVVPVGLLIRSQLPESKDYKDAAHVAAPLKVLLQRHRRKVVAAIGLRFAENGGSHLMLPFALAFGKLHGVSAQTLLMSATLGMLADSVMMPVFGALSDRVGRRPVYAFGVVSMALFAGPFLMLIASGQTLPVVAAFIVGNGICHAAMIGVQPTLFAEMFEPEVRYSGLSVAHEGAAVIVGWVPLIATALYSLTGQIYPVAILMAALCGITMIAMTQIGARDNQRELELQ